MPIVGAPLGVGSLSLCPFNNTLVKVSTVSAQASTDKLEIAPSALRLRLLGD